MQKPLKPCNEPGFPNQQGRVTANSTNEPNWPMTNTGNQLPNGGITASGGRRALVTCPSIRYVLSA